MRSTPESIKLWNVLLYLKGCRILQTYKSAVYLLYLLYLHIWEQKIQGLCFSTFSLWNIWEFHKVSAWRCTSFIDLTLLNCDLPKQIISGTLPWIIWFDTSWNLVILLPINKVLFVLLFVDVDLTHVRETINSVLYIGYTTIFPYRKNNVFQFRNAGKNFSIGIFFEWRKQ